MLDTIAKAFLIDQNALILVICLALLVFVITKVAIDNWLIAMPSLPIYIVGALYSNYWMRELGFAASSDKIANIAFASGIGFMVGILVLVFGYRLISGLFSG